MIISPKKYTRRLLYYTKIENEKFLYSFVKNIPLLTGKGMLCFPGEGFLE